MTDTTSNDLSFLYPEFFAMDQSIGDINANLTRLLAVLENAIGMAEKHAPHLPQLATLRERRKMVLGWQRAAFSTSEHIQSALLTLEDDYARRTGLAIPS